MTDTERAYTLTWTLDAPRADVFRAWTDPAHLDWFYNDQNPVPAEPIELDLRVGGVWRQKMVISERTAYFTGGVYREIVPDEKLVFAWGAMGGWPELDPDRLDDSPQVTVSFAQVGTQTELTVSVELPRLRITIVRTAEFPTVTLPKFMVPLLSSGSQVTTGNRVGIVSTISIDFGVAAFEPDGASRTRTGDLLGAIQTLSQLSYSPAVRKV